MAQRPTTRSLPSINSHAQLLQYLQGWRKTLGKVLQKPLAPQIPWNFSITNQRGGFLLQWSAPDNADGYELLRSDTGDFTGVDGNSVVVIPLRNAGQTSYFDAVGGASRTKAYRLRATSGTINAPHSVIGNATGVVSHTSIDSSDTTTVPTTLYDGTTVQTSQTGSGGSSGTGGSGGGGGTGSGGTGGGTSGTGRTGSFHQ